MEIKVGNWYVVRELCESRNPGYLGTLVRATAANDDEVLFEGLGIVRRALAEVLAKPWRPNPNEEARVQAAARAAGTAPQERARVNADGSPVRFGTYEPDSIKLEIGGKTYPVRSVAYSNTADPNVVEVRRNAAPVGTHGVEVRRNAAAGEVDESEDDTTEHVTEALRNVQGALETLTRVLTFTLSTSKPAGRALRAQIKDLAQSIAKLEGDE